MGKKINLYLDLDETLIYSIDKRYQRSKIDKLTKLKHHHFDQYIVIHRPNIDSFLDWICSKFNVYVWSAGSKEYVENIVEQVINKKRKIPIVLHYGNCEDSLKYYGEDALKDLRLLWEKYQFQNHNEHNTLLLDDLITNTSKYQPFNSIRIKKFKGNIEQLMNDNELDKIVEKLKLVLQHFKDHNTVKIKNVHHYKKSLKKVKKSKKK